jgi:hypothetical protein
MIKQVIKYSSNNSYFAGFLQNIINKSGIIGSVNQYENKIVLQLDDSDEKALERFSELSTRELPHSMFIEDIKTEVIEGEVIPSDFKSKAYDIALCPKCLEDITNPASKHYLDDTLVCTHYCNEPFVSSDNTTFSPHYSMGASILVCDASKVDEMFILTAEEKKLLFSIEKPTIKVTIKSDEIKEFTGRNFIDIKAPYNTRSTLVAINAKDADMPYMFFQSSDDLNVIKVQENFSIIKASRVAKELNDINSNPTINRFENLAYEANYGECVGANLSTKGIGFLIKTTQGTKETVKFKEFDLQDTLSLMKEDEIRAKLLHNFQNQFASIYDKLADGNYDLFETLSIILDVKEIGFNGLSEKALEFRGNGGLKIDINYDGESVDYSALLGSVISFRLAGADDFYIAYSVFEAIADTAIATLNQLKNKFDIKDSIMLGDMFANSVLYSRILSKYQLANPYFSKDIAFDE